MKQAANIITFSRIAAALSLFFLPRGSIIFIIFYIYCGVSDMLDGFIARKMHTESKFGEKLDSLADIIFIAACFIVLFPIMNISQICIVFIIIVLVIRLVNFIAGLVIFRKPVLLHTPANKFVGLLLFIFPLAEPYVGQSFQYILCISALIASAQEGYLIFSRKI